MANSSGSSGDLALSRYECKYFLTPAMADRMREFIKPFVRPDAYAANSPGYHYTVCSLYLDSPDLSLYGMTAHGEKNRFKLRIRRYSDDEGAPVFLEIKRRVEIVVLKRRTRVTGEFAHALLDSLAGLGEPMAADAPTNAVAQEFIMLARTVAAQPMMRVKYEREAYESTAGDPVRITFDTGLVHSVTTESSTAVGGGQWDATPLEGVILEVKFTDVFPSWIRAVIDSFQLQKQSIAKYALSVEDAVENHRYVPQGRARIDMLTRNRPWRIGT